MRVRIDSSDVDHPRGVPIDRLLAGIPLGHLDKLEGDEVAESLHVLTVFESLPGRNAEALLLAQQIGHEMSTSPGALHVRLLQGLHRPDHLEIISSWGSQDAYERALRSSGLVARLREMDELLAAPVDDRLHHAISGTAAGRSG